MDTAEPARHRVCMHMRVCEGMFAYAHILWRVSSCVYSRLPILGVCVCVCVRRQYFKEVTPLPDPLCLQL